MMSTITPNDAKRMRELEHYRAINQQIFAILDDGSIPPSVRMDAVKEIVSRPMAQQITIGYAQEAIALANRRGDIDVAELWRVELLTLISAQDERLRMSRHNNMLEVRFPSGDTLAFFTRTARQDYYFRNEEFCIYLSPEDSSDNEPHVFYLANRPTMGHIARCAGLIDGSYDCAIPLDFTEKYMRDTNGQYPMGVWYYSISSSLGEFYPIRAMHRSIAEWMLEQIDSSALSLIDHGIPLTPTDEPTII